MVSILILLATLSILFLLTIIWSLLIEDETMFILVPVAGTILSIGGFVGTIVETKRYETELITQNHLIKEQAIKEYLRGDYSIQILVDTTTKKDTIITFKK